MRAEALTPSIPPKYKSLWLRPASLHPVGARKAGRRAPHGRAVRRPSPTEACCPDKRHLRRARAAARRVQDCG